MNTAPKIKPEAGMPGFYSIGSDTYPVTVVSVSASGHRVVAREDQAIRTDDNGLSESQSYLYAPQTDGKEVVFTRRENGRYALAGAKNYGFLTLGRRAAYRDPSF